MNKNVIIDLPERIDDRIEDFKLGAAEDEKNYTTAKIKLCREPETDKPLLFYSQELIRNFKDPYDPFGKRHLIKVFTPSNHQAVADTSLESKFKDTVLAHKDRIVDYSPLTDISSANMNLFIDEDTAQFMDDVGINVDGMGEDFQSIESVSASPFHEEVSYDSMHLKRELRSLEIKLSDVKRMMVDEFEEYADPQIITDEEFNERLARENISANLTQDYLSTIEQINRLKSQLGELSSAVFSEISTKIRLPRALEVNDGLFAF